MTSKSRLVKVSLASLVVVLTAFVFAVEASKQLKDRTLKRNGWRNEPVKIFKIKNAKREIALGRKFADGDDWLQGLTVRVKNVSDKPIKFIELELHFPPADGPEGAAVPVFQLMFGRVSTPEGGVAPATTLIMPGEFGELTLADSDYESLMQLLDGTGGSAVELILRQVYFADGTKWEGGLEQDRNGSTRYAHSRCRR